MMNIMMMIFVNGEDSSGLHSYDDDSGVPDDDPGADDDAY